MAKLRKRLAKEEPSQCGLAWSACRSADKRLREKGSHLGFIEGWLAAYRCFVHGVTLAERGRTPSGIKGK